jgi:hypothetical protein
MVYGVWWCLVQCTMQRVEIIDGFFWMHTAMRIDIDRSGEASCSE